MQHECREYIVCEKTDGHRYLLVHLVSRDGRQDFFLVSRKNAVTTVSPRSVAPLPPMHEDRKLVNLFDGELVLDRHNSTPSFLVFDALNVFEPKNVML